MQIFDVMYMFFQYGVPLAAVGALFGFRWQEGLWGNAVAVLTVFFSFLIAVGWWESLTVLLVGQVNQMLFFADFLMFWAIFLVSLAILNEATLFLSRVKVKFAEPVEKAGNAVALGFLSLVLLGGYAFSLDLSAVGENESASVPSDSIQVKVLQNFSEGSLSAFGEPRAFNGSGSFRSDHLKRKQALMDQVKSQNGKVFYEGSIPSRKSR